jgi:hypothetical protein
MTDEDKRTGIRGQIPGRYVPKVDRDLFACCGEFRIPVQSDRSAVPKGLR